MNYQIVLEPKAQAQLQEWGKSGQKKILQKIYAFFEELREHPRTGTGQVEQLKGNLQGYWSRRIDKQSRLVYRIEDDVVIVTVVSVKGHYTDK